MRSRQAFATEHARLRAPWLERTPKRYCPCCGVSIPSDLMHPACFGRVRGFNFSFFRHACCHL